MEAILHQKPGLKLNMEAWTIIIRTLLKKTLPRNQQHCLIKHLRDVHHILLIENKGRLKLLTANTRFLVVIVSTMLPVNENEQEVTILHKKQDIKLTKLRKIHKTIELNDKKDNQISKKIDWKENSFPRTVEDSRPPLLKIIDEIENQPTVSDRLIYITMASSLLIFFGKIWNSGSKICNGSIIPHITSAEELTIKMKYCKYWKYIQ